MTRLRWPSWPNRRSYCRRRWRKTRWQPRWQGSPRNAGSRDKSAVSTRVTSLGLKQETTRAAECHAARRERRWDPREPGPRWALATAREVRRRKVIHHERVVLANLARDDLKPLRSRARISTQIAHAQARGQRYRHQRLFVSHFVEIDFLETALRALQIVTADRHLRSVEQGLDLARSL